MKCSKNIFSRWFLVAGYAAFIFFLSSSSHPLPESVQKYFSGWILHGVEYGVFGFLLIRALVGTFERHSRLFLFITALILGILYGVSDEWHQCFVPNRHASAQDVVADGLGVFLGALTWIKRNPHAGN